MKKSLIAAGLFTLAGQVQAAGCATVFAKHDQAFRILASPSEFTYLRFSAPYRHYKLANEELWEKDDAGGEGQSGAAENELSIKPKLAGLTATGEAVIRYNGFDTAEQKGERDMLTALRGSKMEIYKAAVHRYRHTNMHVTLDTPQRTHYAIQIDVTPYGKEPPPCYVIQDTEAAATVAQDANKPKGTVIAAQQYRDAMAKYHSSLHTQYAVKLPEDWSAAPLTSVYDDGRFTYVRLDPRQFERNKAPITFFGNVDGHRHLVQVDFDGTAENPMYKIHGVFVGGLYAVQGVHANDSIFTREEGHIASIEYLDKALSVAAPVPIQEAPAQSETIAQPGSQPTSAPIAVNNNMGTW